MSSLAWQSASLVGGGCFLAAFIGPFSAFMWTLLSLSKSALMSWSLVTFSLVALFLSVSTLSMWGAWLYSNCPSLLSLKSNPSAAWALFNTSVGFFFFFVSGFLILILIMILVLFFFFSMSVSPVVVLTSSSASPLPVPVPKISPASSSPCWDPFHFWTTYEEKCSWCSLPNWKRASICWGLSAICWCIASVMAGHMVD